MLATLFYPQCYMAWFTPGSCDDTCILVAAVDLALLVVLLSSLKNNEKLQSQATTLPQIAWKAFTFTTQQLWLQMTVVDVVKLKTSHLFSILIFIFYLPFFIICFIFTTIFIICYIFTTYLWLIYLSSFFLIHLSMSTIY